MSDRALYAARILLSVTMALLFFSSLDYLPLAEALAITFAAPIFNTALAGPILGERVGARPWAAVLTGFAGMLAIVRPGADTFQPAALLPLGSALCYALVMQLTRHLSRTDSNAAILWWTTLGVVGVTAAMVPPTWITPGAADWGVFAFLGLTSAGATYFLTVAYRHAPASVLAPLDYTVLLWGLAIGWIGWHEVPDPVIAPGVIIVVAAGLFLVGPRGAAPRRRR